MLGKCSSAFFLILFGFLSAHSTKPQPRDPCTMSLGLQMQDMQHKEACCLLLQVLLPNLLQLLLPLQLLQAVPCLFQHKKQNPSNKFSRSQVQNKQKEMAHHIAVLGLRNSSPQRLQLQNSSGAQVEAAKVLKTSPECYKRDHSRLEKYPQVGKSPEGTILYMCLCCSQAICFGMLLEAT